MDRENPYASPSTGGEVITSPPHPDSIGAAVKAQIAIAILPFVLAMADYVYPIYEAWAQDVIHTGVPLLLGISAIAFPIYLSVQCASQRRALISSLRVILRSVAFSALTWLGLILLG